jgi:DEAD/DEAH box helicase domain-containing protein
MGSENSCDLREGSPVGLFLKAVKPTVIERVEIAARAGRFAPPPAPYSDGRIGTWLAESLGGLDRVYSHQSAALSMIGRGKNVVVATPTASGKSLIFMAAAFEKLLSDDGRTLVFYPQKALGGDQLARWRAELKRLGMDEDLVGEITGDVSMTEREHVLDRSRIILSTPDAIHCWLMRMLHLPSVQRFLTSLDCVVIDEAHAFDGVFGSQFAFFFRRLRDACRRSSPGRAELQVVAATATLRDPRGHLEALTALPFEVIDEADNGSPSHGLTVLHIDGPEVGATSEKAGAEIMSSLLEAMPAKAAAIGFADSRQGVERIARRIKRGDAKPYRSGYTPRERRAIEANLREGGLRAIFSTSATELGIDISQFAYGLNVGVPLTRKSLRQRAGRIGRSQAGVFAVMAPSAAFAKLGSSLRESITGPVEHSPLYLGNLFIQFQQARCYLRELGCEGEVPELRPELGWPAGFEQALAMALPGAARPPMLDEVANAGWDNPHLAYLLRSMPTISFALKNARTGETIGMFDHEKALREAYPGGTYIHLGAHYRVTQWINSSYEHAIRLQPLKKADPTYPLTRFQIGASVEPAELIEGHLLKSDEGCLAEAQLRCVESVEGYRIGTTSLLYRDLREHDRRLSRKQREFMTSGVILQIDAPWFAGTADGQVAVRRAVATALETIISREYGIALSDIRAVHCGIALHSLAGTRKIDNAVVLFDTISGGLRLSAPLYEDFEAIIGRLERGAELAGSEALLGPGLVARLRSWHQSLRLAAPPPAPVELPEGKHLVFAPSSRVSVRVRGQTIERVLLEPQLLAIGNSEQLMYRYEDAPGVQAWVAHDQVEAVGNDWQRAIWDPATNHLEPLELSA